MIRLLFIYEIVLFLITFSTLNRPSNTTYLYYSIDKGMSREMKINPIDYVNTSFYDMTLLRYNEIMEQSFGDESELLLFCEYIATQSNNFDTRNNATDVKWVVCTILNRLDKYGVDFNTYYNLQRVSHSHSICKMKRIGVRNIIEQQGKRKHINNIYDLCLTLTKQHTVTSNAKVNSILGAMCPNEILYFESFKTEPNRGVHKKDKFVKQFRHRFYTD